MRRFSGPFVDGVRISLPVLLGLVPFGMVAGITAVDAGFSPVQAMGLSVVVFAGAAQLAAIDLVGEGATFAVVVLTAVVINVRHIMYSASLAPYLRDLPLRRKALMAYLLTDQAYAFSVDRYADTEAQRRGATGDDPDAADAAESDAADAAEGDATGAGEGGTVGDASAPTPIVRGGDGVAYYFGVALTPWVAWQLSTAAGVVLGRGVPESWGLSFALPLVFIALLVPTLVDRPAVLAAVVAGGVALAGGAIPFNLGIVLAAVVGVVAGAAAEEVFG